MVDQFDDNNGATSWGQPRVEHNYKRLGQLKGAYRRLYSIGEVTALVLVACIAVTAITMTFTINYQNLIFDDGSGLTCVLDGKTGALSNGN